MNAQERLQSAIHEEEQLLGEAVPSTREEALLAVIRKLDTSPIGMERDAEPDLVTGRHTADLGGSKAMQLCLESRGAAGAGTQAGAAWAEGFLQGCGRLAEAELVLGHVETGFMRIVEDGDDALDAWIATKRAGQAV